MTLQDAVASINANLFLREFSFDRNCFSPTPSEELEFADHFVWVDDFAILFQVKERSARHVTDVHDKEMNWFQNKVLKKAVTQVRRSLAYMRDYESIELTNERGDTFDLGGRVTNLRVESVVVYGHPQRHFDAQHYLSTHAGFIHVFHFHDYQLVCDTLLTLSEIAEYLVFRADKLLRGTSVSEKALLGHYLTGDLTKDADEAFADLVDHLVQEHNKFDMSFFLKNFRDQIYTTPPSDDPKSYYGVLKELTKLNRIEMREFKTRFVLTVQSATDDEINAPWRFISTNTGCGFVLFACPSESYANRFTALENFTYATKYEQKLQRVVGVCVTKLDEEFSMDWVYLDFPWHDDPVVAKKLAESNPFRPLRSERQPRYRFGK